MSKPAIHRAVEPLPGPVHPHRAIHDLQQRADRQREREHDVQTVAAADARGADAHDDEVDGRDERFEHRGDEVERRLEPVGGREDDLDDGEEDAEAGEGDDDAEGCAVDCAVSDEGLLADVIFCLVYLSTRAAVALQ